MIKSVHFLQLMAAMKDPAAMRAKGLQIFFKKLSRCRKGNCELIEQANDEGTGCFGKGNGRIGL